MNVNYSTSFAHYVCAHASTRTNSFVTVIEQSGTIPVLACGAEHSFLTYQVAVKGERQFPISNYASLQPPIPEKRISIDHKPPRMWV